MGMVEGMGWEGLSGDRPDISWYRIYEENAQAVVRGPYSDHGNQEQSDLGIDTFSPTLGR